MGKVGGEVERGVERGGERWRIRAAGRRVKRVKVEIYQLRRGDGKKVSLAYCRKNI